MKRNNAIGVRYQFEKIENLINFLEKRKTASMSDIFGAYGSSNYVVIRALKNSGFIYTIPNGRGYEVNDEKVPTIEEIDNTMRLIHRSINNKEYQKRKEKVGDNMKSKKPRTKIKGVYGELWCEHQLIKTELERLKNEIEGLRSQREKDAHIITNLEKMLMFAIKNV